MSRPISKSLLIHSATLTRAANEVTDGWDNIKDKGAPIGLTRVRIEPSEDVVFGTNNDEIQLKAILFYDCANSLPKATNFYLDDKIVFNSSTFTVKHIEPLYGNKKLHHYEIGLV